ncbi:MAG: hypothetical protein AB8E82_02705, partial [Aureispira sp.]
ATLVFMVVAAWLVISLFNTTAPFWILVKIVVSAFCIFMGAYYSQRAQLMLTGKAKITITPKEIQQQLYNQQKAWGEREQVPWRKMQGFTTEVPAAKEISITGDEVANERLQQHVSWQQLQELRKWMEYYFKSFNGYYTEEQVRYIEHWAFIQYEHYNKNPQVDELDMDYFLKDHEPLEWIDLSQHLIEDSSL